VNPASPFDFQPTLVGQLVTLRPLKADDFEAVYTAASDPLIWEQHPEPTRYQRDVFEKGYFAGAVASGSAFVVIDNASGKIIGSSRYYEWNPATKEVAIGYTFLTRDYWGTGANPEMKRLMMDHAFRWAKTAWFHIGAENRRSRKALEKIGGRFSHEETKVVHGVEILHAYYKIDRHPTLPTRILQVAVMLMGLAALAFLLWEPHLEGRNAHATFFEIYFKDPFLAFAYVGSIPFFAALYQTFTLLGCVGRGEVCSRASVKSLRTIKFCALAIIGFVVVGEIFIFLGDSDDRAGGVFMGALIALGSVVIAAVAASFERALRKSIP
jgi:RimJ/RimL family protein N-acetyltransferase